jgi:hypothetical protein
VISHAEISRLLTDQLTNTGTQWSLGTFGAIAEFSRDPAEPAKLTTSDTEIAAVTERGAVAIRLVDELRPFASESITRLGWSHRVALCLPENSCAMSQRKVLTELGPDADALRSEDRESALFDLGLGALQADLCIRLPDQPSAARMREHVGRSLFESDNPAMGVILSANPHRVFISRIGRIEVYQPIPPATGKSPDGPHTHLLPKLLKSGRTHPATEPIPEHWVPCAHFYPSHPAKDATGNPSLFDRAQHGNFQRLLDLLGSPETNAIKKRVIAAIIDDQPPFALEGGMTRTARVSVRVVLRQLKASGYHSGSLQAWLETFDRAESETDDDEATKL